MSTPEGLTKKSITDYLSTIENLYWERREAIGGSYKKGLPDIWFIYKGCHVEVEIKRSDGKGRTSVMQDKFLERLNKCGAITTVAENVDDVKNIIDCVDYIKKEEAGH